MERSALPRTNRARITLRLGMPFGLATGLLLAVLWWAGANATSPVLAAPPSQGIETQTNGKVITIGVAAALNYSFGWQQANAVQLAIDQTNAAGGIDIGGIDYSVALAVADSACDWTGTQSISAATQLLAAGSVAVVGHTCSSASGDAAPVYQAAGVAMVTPSSTYVPLTRQGYTTTFRVTPHDGARAIKLAEYFSAMGLMRTAVLNRPYSYSPPLADVYSDTYTALGGTVVSSRTIATTDEITLALDAIAGENVDVIVVTDLSGDVAGEVSRVAYRKGMTPIIALMETLDDYISSYAGPQAAEGDYGATLERDTANMPGYAAFEADYLAASFSIEPTPKWPSWYSYDDANMIVDAISRANTATDTLAIRDQIAATANFAGVVGTYQGFDAYGDIVPQWARAEVVENGKWVPVTIVGEVYPAQGGTLSLGNTLGQTTTIEIPAGATAQTLVLTYTLVATTTNAGVPTMTMMGQHAIRLEMNVAVSGRMTITIEYEDGDVAGIDEATLTLYTWDGSQWVDAAPCGGYIRDLDNNILKIVLCHFSDYVLLGETQADIYLPAILKTAP